MTLVLRAADGREVTLGTREEFNHAMADISSATGGSSARGQFSVLFGLDPDRELPSHLVTRLGWEAAEFQNLCGAEVNQSTYALLDRLATLSR